jgi:hypothetical protein
LSNAKPPGLIARCHAVSSRLVDCWNRRTGVELELQRPSVEPARRARLDHRLGELHAEQDRLEAQLTRLAAQLEADA